MGMVGNPLTMTRVFVQFESFWYWHETLVISVQSVERDKIPALPLVQRNFCYPTNKVFLLLYNMRANAS